MVAREAYWGVSDSPSQLPVSVKGPSTSDVLATPLPDSDRLCCGACWDLGRAAGEDREEADNVQDQSWRN